MVYRRAYLFKNRSIRPMITWPQMAVAVSVAIAINAVMGETSGGLFILMIGRAWRRRGSGVQRMFTDIQGVLNERK